MGESALTLVIETSNPGAGSPGEVALARGEEFVGVRALDPRGRHDDALMPAVAQLCADAGVGTRDLGRVVVSVGPGGFSSLRIAVATAKMIALSAGCACVGVPTCRVAAYGIRGRSLVCLASKRESVWARVYDDGEALSVGVAVEAPGVAALIVEHGCQRVVGDGHLPDAVREWCGANGIEVVAPLLTAEACLAASAGIAPVSAAELAVVYPREPEAVRKWREQRA